MRPPKKLARRDLLRSGSIIAATAVLASPHEATAMSCGGVPSQDIQATCEISILNVGVEGALELLSTLRALETVRILPGAEVTLRLAAGTFTFTRNMVQATRLAGENNGDLNVGLEVRHDNGNRIRIIGAGSSATKLVFENMHGLLLRDGKQLGLIDELELNGADMSGRNYDPSADKQGILARDGSLIRCGSDIIVRRFSRVGIMAFRNSVIYAKGVRSESNGSDGFVASSNSSVEADDAVALGNEGVGFFSEWNSIITASHSLAYLNFVRDPTGENGDTGGGIGFVAREAGIIRAPEATLWGNSKAGAIATTRSLIVLSKSAVTSLLATTVGPGVRATRGSTVECNDIQIMGYSCSLHADQGSNIEAARATLTGPAGATDGVLADHASTIQCEGVTVSEFPDGLVATNASSIFAIGSSVENATRGYVAYLNSTVDARNVECTNVATQASPPVNTSNQAANSYIRG